MTLPIMIFAAGFGTRMGALTKTCPKPLLKVAGRTMLDRSIDLARDISAQPIVVNTHYLGAQIAEHLSDQPILLSPETPEILDTGGGLKQARPLLAGPEALTLNSDAIWAGPNPLAALILAWDPDRMDALLLVKDLAGVTARQGGGDFTLAPEGTLTKGGRDVYLGAQILRLDLLDQVDEAVFSLRRIWEAIPAERLHGLRYGGNWCDVGHPDGLTAAEIMLSQHAL